MADGDGGNGHGDGAGVNAGGGDGGGEDVAGLKSALAAERDANKAVKKLLKDLGTDLDSFVRDVPALYQARDAQKSDLDRLIGERDALKTQAEAAEKALRTERVRSQVRDAAEAAGAHDPGAMWRLIDLDAVEFDAKGRIVNLAEALAAVKEAHPRLFRGPGSADGGAGANGRGGLDINAALRQLAGR